MFAGGGVSPRGIRGETELYLGFVEGRIAGRPEMGITPPLYWATCKHRSRDGQNSGTERSLEARVTLGWVAHGRGTPRVGVHRPL